MKKASIYITLSIFCGTISAFLQYADPTDSCTDSSDIGTAIFCCDGQCADGNGLGQPGLCLNWEDGCNDTVSGTPTCPNSQVMSHGPANSWIDAGIGNCWAGDECQWQKNVWSWTCCDCPTGFVPEMPGECPEPYRWSRSCIGCTDPDEILSNDGTKYVCTSTTPPNTGDGDGGGGGGGSNNDGHKGVNCDIVNKMADQFKKTSAVAPDTNGYYRQLLNLVCLRSNCPNDACDLARNFASEDKDCSNFDGDFTFENKVFEGFASQSDSDSIANTAQVLNEVSEALAMAIKAAEAAVSPIGTLLTGALALSGFGDPLDARTIGAVLPGTGHFLNDLKPEFQKYINDLKASATSKEDLIAKLASMITEHNRLFRCAVVPGFNVEAYDGDLSPIAAKLAGWIIPMIASAVRNAAIPSSEAPELEAAKALAGNKRDEFLDLDTIASILGVNLPVSTELRYNVRNWEQISTDDNSPTRRRLRSRQLSSQAVPLPNVPGVSMAMTELYGQSPNLIKVSLLTDFTLDIPSRDIDLNPMVVQTALFYPKEDVPDSVTVFNFNGQTVSVVGPVASINDPSVGLVLINSTHVMGANFDDPPVLITDRIAASEVPQIPFTPSSDDRGLLYRNATISLSYDPSYMRYYYEPINFSSDITMFDLLTGKPLMQVKFTGSEAGGVFEAPIGIGNGVWGGDWRGGGIFALGYSKDINNSSLTYNSTSNTTSDTLSTSTTSSVSTSTTSSVSDSSSSSVSDSSSTSTSDTTSDTTTTSDTATISDTTTTTSDATSALANSLVSNSNSTSTTTASSASDTVTSTSDYTLTSTSNSTSISISDSSSTTTSTSTSDLSAIPSVDSTLNPTSNSTASSTSSFDPSSYDSTSTSVTDQSSDITSIISSTTTSTLPPSTTSDSIATSTSESTYTSSSDTSASNSDATVNTSTTDQDTTSTTSSLSNTISGADTTSSIGSGSTSTSSSTSDSSKPSNIVVQNQCRAHPRHRH